MKWSGFKTNRKPLVGVDIGTSSLKLVALVRRRDEFVVTRAVSTPLAARAIDAPLADPGEELTAGLRRLMESAGVDRRPVATTLGANAVIVKRLSLPNLPSERQEEIDAAVRAESAKHLPFPASEVNLDYHLIELNEAGTAEVLAVAVKKDRIDERLRIFAAADISVRVIDHDPLAVANCYEFNYQPEPDRTVALLDVGATASTLSVIHGTEPQFSHELGIGGQQYTDALQRECNVDFAEAEAVKRQAHPETRFETVIGTVLHAMRLEIRKTMDFYQAGGRVPTLTAIYVAGGSAAMPGLDEMLKDEFQIDVEVLDPFRRARFDAGVDDLDGARSQYAVAMGLALRAFDGSEL